MINKQRYAFIFLIVLALLDQFLSLIFPVDFTYTTLSFMPHLCFCGFLLMIYNQNLLNRILYACLCGICIGMFFDSQILLNVIMYCAFGAGIGFFKNQIQENDWFGFVYVLVGVFLNDFISFGFFKIIHQLTMPLIIWLVHVEFLTLVVNAIFILVLIYIMSVFSRYTTIKELRYRRFEKMKMENIKRK